MLTAEYWKEIPWYAYILVIGLALIIFAMYDEKRKQQKRLQEENAKAITDVTYQSNQPLPAQMIEQQNIETSLPEQTVEEVVEETVEQPVVEEPTPVDEETAQVVEEQPVVEESPIVEEQPVKKPKLQIVEDTSTEKNIQISKEDQIKKTGAKKSNKTTSANRQKTKTENK